MRHRISARFHATDTARAMGQAAVPVTTVNLS
jgi:hypothetical protein